MKSLLHWLCIQLACSLSCLDTPPMTIEQFLSKLPTSVIKNGNLIPVRQDLFNLLTQPKQQPAHQQPELQQQNVIIDSPALQSLKSKYPELKSAEELFQVTGSDTESAQIATLRIKVVSSQEAESSYLIRMFYSDTIRDLKLHIQAYR